MSGPRLILVDDEPVILRLLGQVFADSEFDVVACADGRTALAAMAQGVDVLLTDKNLPDIGGLQLLDHAKQHQPDCEVLLLTGYASLDTALSAMERGAFDYLIKPPRDIFEVRRRVEQAWNKVKLKRENAALLIALRTQNSALEHALSELKSVQAELVQSEKLAGIGTLAAGIAHEVSSPLFGILGLGEAILDEEDRGLVDGYAKEIVSYAGAIKSIVTQLTGYSRSAEDAAMEPVAAIAVAKEAVLLVARAVGFHMDAVKIEGDPQLRVMAKANELQQVMVNLVKNAVEAVQDRHGDDGGAVRVWVRAVDGAVEIDVQDDGAGIEESKLGAIFDPFYTTKAPGRGTGLGLNIVYRIITRYRGAVQVRSALGEGTTFTVRLIAAE